MYYSDVFTESIPFSQSETYTPMPTNTPYRDTKTAVISLSVSAAVLVVGSLAGLLVWYNRRKKMLDEMNERSPPDIFG